MKYMYIFIYIYEGNPQRQRIILQFLNKSEDAWGGCVKAISFVFYPHAAKIIFITSHQSIDNSTSQLKK